MKTDLERFQELYASLGIELKVIKEVGLPYAHIQNNPSKEEYYRVTLQQSGSCGLDEKEDTTSDKFTGWMEFYSTLSFDMSGKFIQQGFWQ